MSSALDEGTRESLAAGRDTARDMLRAAQKDLQKVFIVFVVGFLGTFYALQVAVWPYLKAVTEARMEAATADQVEIIAQTPFDVILLQAKISLATGILLMLPVFIYFARDALRARGLWPQTPVPRWKLALLGMASSILFLVGLVYGYRVFFPVMFNFLAGQAVGAGFTPTYSIVMWAHFIFLLSLSFGLAAQLPLAMTGLVYADIVQYQTFRDKWRHAAVIFVAFGAVLSPPDPFTQIMWAVPLLALYGGSLYLAKLVDTAKRGREYVSPRRMVRTYWNLLVGAGVVGFLAIYGFYTRGGVETANDILAGFSSRRFLPAGSTLPVDPTTAAAIYGVLGGLFVFGLAFAYVLAKELEAAANEAGPRIGAPREPEDVDVDDLDAEGVRTAPIKTFQALSEEEAMAHASTAMDEDDHEKAQAILDRFDEAQAKAESEGEDQTDGDDEVLPSEAVLAANDDEDGEGAGDDTAETTGAAGAVGGGLADRGSRAAGTFFDDLTDEDDEDEIGGYYTDLKFILDSLRSKTFILVGWMMFVFAGMFAVLYQGGIGHIREDFLRRLPEAVVADPTEVAIITLHPAEALVFMVKLSGLVAIGSTLPLIAYYAWPALREREIVRGHRRVIFAWTTVLLAGLAGGFAFGYGIFAPSVISYLVADTLAADLVIRYRISNFFWLIIFTTLGIGILVDIPVLMILLNTAGVSYRAMRSRWREVTVAILAITAIFTPASVATMFMATIPIMIAYGIGLGVLFVLTIGGRRDLSGYLEAKPTS